MYSIFYETVYFENVSTSIMKEFISTFDMNELTGNIWTKLSKRLCCEITNKQNDKDDNQKVEQLFQLLKVKNSNEFLIIFKRKLTATLLVK